MDNHTEGHDPRNHHGRLMRKPEPPPMTDAEREALYRHRMAMQNVFGQIAADSMSQQQHSQQIGLLNALAQQQPQYRPSGLLHRLGLT